MDKPPQYSHTPLNVINEIIRYGYPRMVTERMDQGCEAYLISFMFHPLRGSQRGVMQQMEKEVERVFATLLNQMFRHPSKIPTLEMPLWIVAPDFPVPKRNKQSLREVTLNGGLHYQGVALQPPGSRLNCPLDAHFEVRQDLYVRPGHALARVHAMPITHDPNYVVEYSFKAIQRGRADFDNVLILPKLHSQMPSDVPFRATPRFRTLNVG